jgi:hypothetical protein
MLNGFCSRERLGVFQVCFSFAAFILSVSIVVGPVSAYTIDLFSKDELINGVSYEDWVAKYWQYLATETPDVFTKVIHENGCHIHQEDSVVMLMDPAVVSGSINQECTIPADRAILISIWTGECDDGMPENVGAPFKQISECARGFDVGQIRGIVKVDGATTAQLAVNDYTTLTNTNATEIYTKEFDITLNNDSRIPHEFGPNTYRAAAHGWFMFLKPLPTGDHTIYLKTTVQPTSLSGGGTYTTAEYTYSLKVQ